MDYLLIRITEKRNLVFTAEGGGVMRCLPLLGTADAPGAGYSVSRITFGNQTISRGELPRERLMALRPRLATGLPLSLQSRNNFP